jgi:murein endopeptidase
VEAGSNTSTVALRIVEGHKKGTQCREYNWTGLLMGDINPPGGGGSLESATVKCGHESMRL